MKTKKLEVLLIDDDMCDVMSLERAVANCHAAVAAVHVSNGMEALEKLRADLPKRPLLILLDINMPVMNGSEFLRQLRADRHLRMIPVIVMTTSDEERDIVAAYNFNVAGYFIKPLHFVDLEENIRRIVAYWTTCKLPF